MADETEVVKDAVSQAQAAQAEGDQAEKESGGTETKQAVEVPEYLKGTVDEGAFAKLPEEARTTLVDYGKRLYGDYTRKNQEVAELRRLQDDLAAEPEKAEALKRALTEYEARKAGILPTPKAKSGDEDDLLSNATPEQRQAFEVLDKRYLKPLHERDGKIAELEKTIKYLQSDTHQSRRTEMERELGKLSQELKPLAEKYREDILSRGLFAKDRNGVALSAERLVQVYATPEEYRKALLAGVPEQTKKQVEKVRQTATGKPQATTATAETAEVSRTASRDPRFKKGSIDVPGMLRGVFDTVKRGMPGT